MVDIPELRHSLERVDAWVRELCKDAPIVLSKYEALLPPLTQAYRDSAHEVPFVYSCMVFPRGTFTFGNGEKYHGYAIGVFYGLAPGEVAKDKHHDSYAFIIVVENEKPVDFIQVKSNVVMQ
jgi:hypothetical protein